MNRFIFFLFFVSSLFLSAAQNQKEAPLDDLFDQNYDVILQELEKNDHLAKKIISAITQKAYVPGVTVNPPSRTHVWKRLYNNEKEARLFFLALSALSKERRDMKVFSLLQFYGGQFFHYKTMGYLRIWQSETIKEVEKALSDSALKTIKR